MHGGVIPAPKRRKSERASVAAAVNETSKNHLGDTTQFREALLYAKQLLRYGILSHGRQSQHKEPLRVPSSSSSYRDTSMVGVGFDGQGLKGTESATVNATAGERRQSFREVPSASVEATTVALCPPTARKNIAWAWNSMSGSEHSIGALDSIGAAVGRRGRATTHYQIREVVGDLWRYIRWKENSFWGSDAVRQMKLLE